ncbi:hypothetical protein, partial [Salmonella sp. s51228]|uniref:hypothetical protein n=1 Tax=Salmonella sp. s51228 TaxID=3159652 RepID=UPI0039811448
MDISFSGVGSMISEDTSKRSDTLVSVTCIMIHKASLGKSKPDGDFIINKLPVQQVKLVGLVIAVMESSTNCSYTIDDGSGALVEVKRWITEGEHS